MEEMKGAAVLLASKVKGKKWAEMALPVLVGISRRVKEMEAERGNEEDEADPAGIIRLSLAEIAGRYSKSIGEVKAKDEIIRERVMNEYQDTETITGDEGELVFPCRWGYKVVDIKKVPPELLTVDGKAVNAEIKNGVRKMRGIEIDTIRGMQVRARKEE